MTFSQSQSSSLSRASGLFLLGPKSPLLLANASSHLFPTTPPHLRHSHHHQQHEHLPPVPTGSLNNYYNNTNSSHQGAGNFTSSAFLLPHGDNGTSRLHGNFTFPSGSTGFKLSDITQSILDGIGESGGGGGGNNGESESAHRLVFPFNLSLAATAEMEDIRSTLTNSTFLLDTSTVPPDNSHAGGGGGGLNSSSIITNTVSSSQHNLYSIIVPLMIFMCVLTCLINLVIVLSARWCRKPMSPTLYFSISLALADAYASFILGLGLVINSLLPFVYEIQIKNKCYALTIEAFR
jgi:hypothetical protein